MDSWSVTAKGGGEAQEVFLYRREVLKSPDEVLSEARKNHSIFKANVVTTSLRPSIRHVGLSRFQFGDGEYAASVESLQRLIAEKTAKPEPLPEMQDPVRLTRTLSRTLSSRRNPFLSPGRCKPRSQPDGGAAAPKRVVLVDSEGDFAQGQAQVQAHKPDDLGAAESEAEVNDAAATEAEPAAASDGDRQAAAAAAAAPPALRSDSMTAAAGSVVCGGRSSGISDCRSSSFHSVKSPPAASPHSRFAAASLPTPTYGSIGLASWSTGGASAGGVGDWDGDCNGDADTGGDRRSSASAAHSNAAAHFIGNASAHTAPSNAIHSGADSEFDGVAGSPSEFASSTFSLFTRRNSFASPVSCQAPESSNTGRVDQLLRNLRKFKAGGPAAAAAAAAAGPRASSMDSGRLDSARVSFNGSGRLDSARVSFNGSGRFESSRELFAGRGRSATLTHLPDDDRPLAGIAAAAADGAAATAAALAAGGSGTVVNMMAAHHHHHHHHHHQHSRYQQQYQQQLQRQSTSQLHLHLQVPSPPVGSAPSSGAPSPLTTRPGAAGFARTSTAGAPATGTGVHGPVPPAPPAAAGSPAAGAAAAAAQPGGGAAASPQWIQRGLRSPTGDGDRPAGQPQSPFSSSAASGPSPNFSAHTSNLATTGAGPAAAAVAAAAAAAATVSAAVGPAPASPALSQGRGGARKSVGEAAAAAVGPVVAAAAVPPSRSTAPGAPLDGWSSRGAGSRRDDGNVRRNVTVGSFFSNLLSVANGQARLTGSANLQGACKGLTD